MPSAYPSEPVEVIEFNYESDLFLTRKIERVKARRGKDANYVVAEDYRATVRIRSPENGSERDFPIRVPAGLVTDLCSVPPIARCFVSRVGPHLEASIVHDWLYVAWQVEEGEGKTETNRKFADDVFRAAMKKANVNSFKCWAMYRAVRCFGGSAFFDEDWPVFAEGYGPPGN